MHLPIVGIPGKPGWYRLSRETARPLFGLPGLEPLPASRDFRAPRNLLTLLDHPDARRILTPPTASTAAWSRRDAVTAPLGFKLRTTQHQALDFIEPRRGALIGDDMRLGKGNRHGTPILTPTGWRPVEALAVGDQVIGSDGRPCAVTGVFPRGEIPVFRVTFSDGASTVVDGEHLWHVWDHNAWARGKPASVLSTQALAASLTYGNHGNCRWRIPLVAPVAFPEVTLPLDPYLVGVLLGDGHLSGTPSFTPGDVDVPAQVRLVLPAGCHMVASQAEGRATAYALVGESGFNPVTAALRELGLWDTRAATKFVPPCYLFASVAQRLALLQGLLDTDGEWSAGVLGFSSASLRLVEAVRFLVESLGGTARYALRKAPRYTYKGEHRTGRPSHRLTIALPSEIAPFRARTSYAPRAKFKPVRLIKSIVPEGTAPVTCISVAATDQLYVTEHCIVTHNTLTAIMAHDPARGRLVVVAPLSARAVWLGWMRRRWPDADIGTLTSRTLDPVKLEKPFVFVHYDVLAAWQSTRPIGTLVFDEAHLLGNHRTKRTAAASILAGAAKKVIALTGTPIWDMPPDLWALVSMLTPGAWGGYYDFCNRYGAPVSTAYGTDYTGLSHGEELKTRMRDVMLRRRWVDVAEDVPPITRSVVVADLDQRERNRLDIIATALQGERTNTAGHLASYRVQVALAKVRAVKAELGKLVARNEPVVVWAWHKETVAKLAEAAPGSFVLTGDVPADERERRITAWRAAPAGVLIATMAVAQVAVDFSHARIALFAEIDYTPAIIAQAEMRTFAPTRGMDVLFVVANHLVEQRILRALIAKLGAADPLGVGAAVDAIDALRDAVMGPTDVGDLDRLLADMLASIA